MNTLIKTQVEVVLPPFSDRRFLRAANGEHEGGRLPRPNSSNPGTKRQAIQLRKESTPPERKLWSHIRKDQLGVTFRRQHAIGNFIPDFVCIEKKLIIELDGSQHLEQEEYDEDRTKYLESLGRKVIRFWNNDVMNNIDGVILAIIDALEDEIREE